MANLASDTVPHATDGGRVWELPSGVRVAAGGEAPPTSVPGGGVAGTRVSPDCRVFLEFLNSSGRAVDDRVGAAVGGASVEADASASAAGRTVQGSEGAHSSRSSTPSTAYSDIADVELRCPPSGRCDSSMIPVMLSDVRGFLDLATQTAAVNAPRLPLLVQPLHFGSGNDLDAALARLRSSRRQPDPPQQDSPQQDSPQQEQPESRHYEEQHQSPKTNAQGSNLVVVGAAVTYWECVFEPLVVTVRSLVERHGATVFLGYFKRDWAMEKRFWTKLLKGLSVEVVFETLLTQEESNIALHAPICSTNQSGGDASAAGESGAWNARVYRIRAGGTGGEGKHDRGRGSAGGIGADDEARQPVNEWDKYAAKNQKKPFQRKK